LASATSGRPSPSQHMAISVVMPALEIAQETGKLISWRKKEGDPVAKGEPLFEVETDKAVMEVESPGDGILAGINVQAGAEVPVGRTIAWIIHPGEAIPAEAAPIERSRTNTASYPMASTTESAASTRNIKISPKARRLAAERGIELTRMRGSGPGGEILASDVLALAASPASPESTFSRLMAERTTHSWTTVPHFFVAREVDAGALVQERERLAPAVQQKCGVKLTHTDLLVALVARVLLRHPKLNATWAGGRLSPNPDVNVGLAVAVSDGVVAPVIHNAHKAELGAIAARRHEVSDRARAGKLNPSDIAGGTFTISNLGMLGVDAFTAIITSPQVAILAVGRIAERVVPIDGRPGIRAMMTLTLSSDHRVIDGARAAEFLHDLAAAIGNPRQWLD
jgi:pyruvate dehydrogenase E2 component (dihydrolipoyllysine-residue acetyltransferase)